MLTQEGLRDDDIMAFVVDTRGDATLAQPHGENRGPTMEEQRLERMLFGRGVTKVCQWRGVCQSLTDDGLSKKNAQESEQGEGEGEAWVADLLVGTKEEEEGPSKRARTAVWHDSDDDDVNLKRVTGGRKLRRAPEEHVVSVPDYESRLREQYEAIVPAPHWAQVEPSNKAAEEATLFGSTAPLTLSGKLNPKDPLAIKRLGDVNVDDVSNCVIASAQFHPTSQIALTAGRDRTLRLFQVSEKRCTKLHSAFFLDMPILSSFFIPHSNEVLCLGPKKLFYVYDMESDSFARIPHLMGHHEKRWARAVPAPDGGLSAFLGGESGNIALFDNRSRVVTQTLRMSGPAEHATFSPDSNYLWTAGSEAQVFKWDMRMTGRRCVSRFSDFGGVGVWSMAASPCGHWLAIGDKSGMVNVYDLFKEDQPKPTPAKTLDQLVTSITGLSWNHNGQMLCMSSMGKSDALRMVHMPSFKVVENWPQNVKPSPLGHVSATCFSPNSGYFLAGNSAGKALLYRFLAFDAY